MAAIEIKPEAPWIRRSDQGVIFTDQVVKYDIELSQSSSSSEEEEEGEEEGEEEDYVANAQELFEQDRIHARREISDDENYGHMQEDEQEEPKPRMTGNQLREFFRLDQTTAAKLSRINN